MKKIVYAFLISIILIISFIIVNYINTSFSFFDFIDKIDNTVTFGLLIANGLVAVLIAYQSHQSNNHFLDLNRPWIQLDLGHIDTTTYQFDKPNSCTTYPLFLVNRGNLSASDVEIVFLLSESVLKYDDYIPYIPNHINFNLIPPNFKFRMINDISSMISESDCIVYSISYKFNGKSYNNKAFLKNSDGLVPTCTDKMPSIFDE